MAFVSLIHYFTFNNYYLLLQHECSKLIILCKKKLIICRYNKVNMEKSLNRCWNTFVTKVWTKNRKKNFYKKVTEKHLSKKLLDMWLWNWNLLHCFLCFLFYKIDSNAGSKWTWIKIRTTDLHHFSENMRKHESFPHHFNSSTSFVLLGKINILCQLSSAYKESIIFRNKIKGKKIVIFSKELLVVKNFALFLI